MLRALLVFAAVSGFTAIGLGALAAHSLKTQLAPHLFNAFQTGVQYQMYHALALIALVALQQTFPSPWLIRSGMCFVLGSVLFCGSLYLLALGGPRWLGPITPIGGLVFLGGWLCLVIAAWQVKLR